MSKLDKVLYTAKTHTTGGREGGVSRSADGRLEVKLSRPGGPGSGTNPEQLFATGWSACFISAMQFAAGKMKIALPADLAIDAEVDLGRTEDTYGLAARLQVSMPGIERDVAERLIEAADKLCPYSRATRGNIDVAINLI
jgi:lipoyl-dependent peroxiredoxin